MIGSNGHFINTDIIDSALKKKRSPAYNIYISVLFSTYLHVNAYNFSIFKEIWFISSQIIWAMSFNYDTFCPM